MCIANITKYLTVGGHVQMRKLLLSTKRAHVLVLSLVRDTFCSYSVMEMSVRELASQVTTLKEKGVNLAR